MSNTPADIEIEVFGVRGVLQAHRGRPPSHETFGYQRAAGDVAEVDELSVYQLLGERLRAKAARDYASADLCREKLRAMHTHKTPWTVPQAHVLMPRNESYSYP